MSVLIGTPDLHWAESYWREGSWLRHYWVEMVGRVPPDVPPATQARAILSGVSSKISLRMTGAWRPGA